MSKEFNLNDLLTKDRVEIYRLNTKVLQEYYTNHISPSAYTFNLSNGESINMIFEESQFCHLIGFHYFGYERTDGWNRLQANPKKVTNFSNYAEYEMMQHRIAGFHQLHKLLQSPDIYIYKAADYPQFNYNSNYFAVLVKNNKYYKLGIGTSKNGLNYPETYIVDMDKPQFNFYLKPENKLAVINSKILPVAEFFDQRLRQNIIDLYAPRFPGIKYISVDTAKQIDELNKRNGSALSITQMKELYQKAGKTYEQDRSTANRETFKDIYDICKSLQAAYKEYVNEAAATKDVSVNQEATKKHAAEQLENEI